MKVERVFCESQHIPEIKVYGLEGKVLEALDTSKFESADAIVKKIERINEKESKK